MCMCSMLCYSCNCLENSTYLHIFWARQTGLLLQSKNVVVSANCVYGSHLNYTAWSKHLQYYWSSFFYDFEVHFQESLGLLPVREMEEEMASSSKAVEAITVDSSTHSLVS